MKAVFFFSFFMLYCITSNAQQKALNIAGIHQLVGYSKSENNLQNQARDKQTITTANEEANKTMLAKLQNKYHELQQRYNTLGTLINTANIGIQATPMVNRIVQNQIGIYQIASENPGFILLASQSELEFVNRGKGLLNYLVGLSASFGAVNQMKASDRKILFDYILIELSTIQDLSSNLLNSMRYSQAAGLLKSISPFQNYIDQDKAIVQDIITNAKYLKP